MVPIYEIHLIPELFAQPPLAIDTVRYAGERVVAVVAESFARGRGRGGGGGRSLRARCLR